MFFIWAIGIALFMHSPSGYLMWWAITILPFYHLIGKKAVLRLEKKRREAYLGSPKLLFAIGIYLAIALLPVYWAVAIILFSPAASEILITRAQEILETYDVL